MLCEKYKGFLSWIVYQIYPRSFNDSNGDGIGDLRGIIEKLDYLKELGINAIWICPCYKSPNVDNGYDIADYYDINEDFGNMDDMTELIDKAHDRGIRIIMDLVPNHTSAEHKWFQESKKSRDNQYSDYYYWYDEPPTNWKSDFGGTAWEYSEERGQYYLHRYAVSMPDINWDNPKVRRGIHDVVDFWADKGVDGFRCDVIYEISKDIPNNIMTMGPHIHEYIHGIFSRPESEHLFTVGECWVYNKESFANLTKAERGELSTMFQFSHLEFGRKGKYTANPQSLKNLRDTLIKWQNIAYEDDLLYTLFTDNHDQSPFISRSGDTEHYHYELATCIATMFYTLRGIPFIYQGQEYGTISPQYDSIDDFRDVSAKNYFRLHKNELGEEVVMQQLNFGSRDNARHPIAWNGGKNGGFSEAEPWIPLNTHYKEINLEKDRNSDKSVFNFYKELLGFRKESEEILYGDFKVLSKEEDGFFLFERELEGKKILICCNFEEENKIEMPYEVSELLISNYNKKDVSNSFAPFEIAICRV